MRVLIICFSLTGNTGTIADQIQAGIGQTGAECRTVTLGQAGGLNLAAFDLIGLGSPVYYYQEPFNVRDFLESLPQQQGRPWFVFCTHGNVIGNFFPSVAGRLEAKGAQIIGYHHCYAGITVPFYPEFTYTTGHPDQRDLGEAREFGRWVTEEYRAATGGDGYQPPEPGPVSSEHWMQMAATCTPEFVSQAMPRLEYDPGLCDQCGLCADNCPVGGIDLEAEPPRMQEPCIYCHQCVTLCPTGALNADWSRILAMAPAQYEAYLAELRQAEARGEFRWLVDPDQVDPTKARILEK